MNCWRSKDEIKTVLHECSRTLNCHYYKREGSNSDWHSCSRWLMPAIPSSAYFEPVPNKRRIRAIRFSDFESTNVVTSHELNNNKCFSTKRCNSNIYRNSFFVRTVHNWNQLDNATVSVTSVESFRTCLSHD
jgi:hypothetical protein